MPSSILKDLFETAKMAGIAEGMDEAMRTFSEHQQQKESDLYALEVAFDRVRELYPEEARMFLNRKMREGDC
jgi:hypothetical protein